MTYFHSVVLDEDKCIGCTNCIKRCPTQAIRVKDGKAMILQERCIDCGECIRTCPQGAKKSITDSIDETTAYKYKIALTAPTLMGQFDENIPPGKILSALKLVGFDHVYEVARGADVSTYFTKQFLEQKGIRPLISSSCPAIVRLIQARFPNLIEHLVTLQSPMEISAMSARKQAIKNNPSLSEEDIGVFFISPCPAKVTSTHNPIGSKASHVNGVLSISSLYPLIMNKLEEAEDNDSGVYTSSSGIGWARPNGEVIALGIKNYLTVDGIENAISVLDTIDNGKLDHIDFIEITACPSGCVGGPLNVENKFIARRRIRYLADKYKNQNIPEIHDNIDDYLFTEDIPSNDIEMLGKNIIESMNLMEKIEEIFEILPDNLDCGACGAPTCKALAEDIVLGRAELDDCIVLLKDKLKLSSDEAEADTNQHNL